MEEEDFGNGGGRALSLPSVGDISEEADKIPT
jgi:hypothetical protein